MIYSTNNIEKNTERVVFGMMTYRTNSVEQNRSKINHILTVENGKTA